MMPREVELIQVFSEGSPLGLIAQLIESEELSEDDIRELERIACGSAKTLAPECGHWEKGADRTQLSEG